MLGVENNARPNNARPNNARQIEKLQQIFAADAWTFMTNCVYTFDNQSSVALRPYPAYPPLKALVEAIDFKNGRPTHRLVAVPKSRRTMASWTLIAHSIWLAAFRPYRLILVQSEKESKARELVISRGRCILEHIPPYILPCDYRIRRNSIEFKNGSSIVGIAQGPDQAVQYGPTRFFMDEAALQPEAEQAFTAIAPALQDGGQFVAVSTPRYQDWFWRFCGRPTGDFYENQEPYIVEGVYVMPLHWSLFPGRDERWMDSLRRELQLTPGAIAREYDVNFSIPVGAPVFKPPFDRKTHVASTHIAAHPGLPLIRGWDYGFRHPAVVFMQVAANGQLLYLDEAMGDNIPLDMFVEVNIERSKEIMGVKSFKCLDFDDPAGMHRESSGYSPRDVMMKHGIIMMGGRKRVPLKESILLMRENMEIRPDGRPGALFNECCETLIRAMDGVYASSKADFDIKTKRQEERFSGGITEHLVDAARYANWGLYTLGRKPCEPLPPDVHAVAS